jgi:hypothetical protein
MILCLYSSLLCRFYRFANPLRKRTTHEVQS